MSLFLKRVIVTFLFLSCILVLNAQLNENGLIEKINALKQTGDMPAVAEHINKLAFLYWENGNQQKAIETFEQSLAINKEIGNLNAMKAIYNNIGMIYSDIGQPETSIVFFRKSLLISRKQNNKTDIATNQLNIATALSLLNRFDEAMVDAREALQLSTELQNVKLLKSSYGLLAELYKNIGDSDKSMEYFSLFSSFQHDLQQKEIDETMQTAAKIEQEHKKTIIEKKQTEQKLLITKDSLKKAEEINEQNRVKMQLQELEIKQKQAELANQRLWTLVLVLGASVLFIFVVFVLRSNRIKRKHNIDLEHRNQEIKAQNAKINHSINYAKNIQGALLPSQELIAEMFTESFVYFSPRDVVSGDFYWFYKTNTPNPKYFVAAVDCTGHGVPGAFMSMLGMSFLDEIVIGKKITNPANILESMHQMVKTLLKQDTTGNTDGMDIAMCMYDTQTKELHFAGAVNPLVYFVDNEMNIVKADFFGVGGQMKGNERMFKNNIIKIDKPVTCYLFSDGFADQFGGPDGKKYFMKNFKILLQNICSKPMSQQKQILNDTLNNWLNNKYNRVDDILVIGFKIQ